MYEEPTEVTETITEELQPFTEDTINDEEACILCSHKQKCLIIKYVNKLAIKRDGKSADDKFSCSLYKEAE